MNIVKVQTEMLKMLIKGNILPVWKKDDDHIVIGDGKCMFWIPEKDFHLKMESKPFPDTRKVLKVEDKNYHLAHCVGYFDQEIGNKKYTLVHLKDDHDRFAYIDKKYTAYFDKDADYYILSPREPVVVMEDGQKVGLIFPVLCRREND